ncbi:hypothetical protein CN098_36310, partial [Sinorhizobium meliloti]
PCHPSPELGQRTITIPSEASTLSVTFCLRQCAPLFLDSPDTADTAFPSSAHIDWFCWVAFDVLADPRYQMPPRSDGPPEFGAPNLTGQ